MTKKNRLSFSAVSIDKKEEKNQSHGINVINKSLDGKKKQKG